MSFWGVLTRFYSKIIKIPKWEIYKCSKIKGFSVVDFPIKLIFYGTDFWKVITTYRIVFTVRSPEENVPLG